MILHIEGKKKLNPQDEEKATLTTMIKRKMLLFPPYLKMLWK
jgi:hypothetical protein